MNAVRIRIHGPGECEYEREIIMSNLQWQRELATADTILFEQWPTKPISTNIMQITHRIMQHFKHYTQLRFMVNNI